MIYTVPIIPRRASNESSRNVYLRNNMLLASVLKEPKRRPKTNESIEKLHLGVCREMFLQVAYDSETTS